MISSFNEEYRFNTRKYNIIAENTIVTLDRNTGKVLKSSGSNMFYMPHGITLDSDGNVWVTDVARHQVFIKNYYNLINKEYCISKSEFSILI